jgi:hypothetical protein
MIATAAKDLGLDIASVLCPSCGSAMFVKKCPCPFTRKGWATCAKCVGCGHTVGLTMRSRSARGGAPGRRTSHHRAGSPFRNL